MDATTRDLVRQRAGDRCEYCRLYQDHIALRHHIEHITAKQHGRSDDAHNLALAYAFEDKVIGPLARPTALTPLMSAVQVLNMNDARRLELRTEVLKRGELS